MSACAGSLTEGVPTLLVPAPISSSPLACPWTVLDSKSIIFKHFAGQVRMDRARQDWVHEYAETGQPEHPSDRHLSQGLPVPQGFWPQDWRGIFGAQLRSPSAIRPCPHPRPNGDRSFRHKLSANGFPQHSTRSAGPSGQLPRFLAPWGHSTLSAAAFA